MVPLVQGLTLSLPRAQFNPGQGTKVPEAKQVWQKKIKKKIISKTGNSESCQEVPGSGGTKIPEKRTQTHLDAPSECKTGR